MLPRLQLQTVKEIEIMTNVNEYLKTSIAKVEQLENMQNLKERREQTARKKMEDRRHFDFGRLVCKYFPDEDKASFENLLRALSDNPELFARLKAEVVKYAQLN